jgi:hypothetical protein
MISSQNNGKIVSGEWERRRIIATRDKDKFTTEELSFLDFTQDGIIGKLDRFDNTMNIGTRPVDPYDVSQDYDWRENPEVGF